MQTQVLSHYRKYSLFTYPGLYEDYLKTLPDNINELGLLLRSNFIHRSTLESGNVGTNSDLKYGDMTKVPWWRQVEDDNLTTTAAMLAELFRRDPKGLTMEKKLQEIDKLALFMQDPDKNFQELFNIWNTKKEFRLLKGGLL